MHRRPARAAIDNGDWHAVFSKTADNAKATGIRAYDHRAGLGAISRYRGHGRDTARSS
jgi:hypothetical protein